MERMPKISWPDGILSIALSLTGLRILDKLLNLGILSTKEAMEILTNLYFVEE